MLIHNTEIYCSPFWRLGSLRSSHQQIQCLEKAPFFLVHRQHLLTVSSHGQKRKGTLWDFLYESTNALIPFLRTLPLWPNHLPNIPPTNAITLGIQFQSMNLWGGTNFKAIAVMMAILQLYPWCIIPCMIRLEDNSHLS